MQILINGIYNTQKDMTELFPEALKTKIIIRKFKNLRIKYFQSKKHNFLILKMLMKPLTLHSISCKSLENNKLTKKTNEDFNKFSNKKCCFWMLLEEIHLHLDDIWVIWFFVTYTQLNLPNQIRINFNIKHQTYR